MGLIEKLLGKELIEQLEKERGDNLQEEEKYSEKQEKIRLEKEKVPSWDLLKIGIGMICITFFIFYLLYLSIENDTNAISKAWSPMFLIMGFIFIGMPLLFIALALIIINLFRINKKISRIFAFFLVTVTVTVFIFFAFIVLYHFIPPFRDIFDQLFSYFMPN